MDKQTSGLTVNDSISHHSTSTVTLKVKVEVAEKVPDEPQYILYSWRWVILFFFAMNELLNTMVYPVCNPIAPAIGKIYGKGAIVVAMTATLFLFMHPLFTFPASYTIINKGVAYSVKIGATLTLLGTLVRCFALVSSFYWILLGQTLSGIGRPFILNSQASIAQNWFPAEQRTQIVTLLNFMITFSGILGQIVPSIFFGGYKTEDDDADFSVGKAKFERLLLLESALVIVFMVPTYFVMKSNPPTPPSHFANKNTKLNFSESLRGLFTDRKFIFIFMSFSLFFGTFKGFGVALPYIVSPFGYYATDIAILASMPIIGGFCSSLVVPSIYKKWQRYKPILLVMQIFTMAMFVLLYYTCWINIKLLVLLDTFLIGLFLIPSVPMNIEWGCKQTYPINDSFCIGIMYSGATLASSFIGEIITLVSGGNESTKKSALVAIIFINLLQVLAVACILFVHEIKHKKLISLHQSFLSQRAMQGQGGTLMDNSDIFASFPHACPEGDPEFYFDVIPYQKVSLLEDEEVRMSRKVENAQY